MARLSMTTLGFALAIISLLSAQPCVGQGTNAYNSLLALRASLETDETYGAVSTAIGVANLSMPIAMLANTTGVTILAPTNEAFGNLGAAVINCLANQPGLTLLSAVLRYHVIQGAFNATTILAAAPVSVPSVNGALLNLTKTGTSVFVNGVPVIDPDTAQLAGAYVVHGISSVLIPPGGLAAVQAYCSSAGCASSPCGAGGVCTPNPSGSYSYTCICSNGFLFNSGTCIPRSSEPYQTRF
ncbi:hypothetical protein KFL_001490050 [Klebsormidium nitens]|uniref:FAS1 domain-containing protein n=1 Tax=Klebsormidium nitens TaxID=105231 RepID=A0A1Y1HXS8_KLENI|nr:hypothetical protein KFL_001490050 [Klebsormidium nitens]|eukprot:GAQ83464.1 hypothetical protein KFL_001490050 [Klebsormidium nitens]